MSLKKIATVTKKHIKKAVTVLLAMVLMFSTMSASLVFASGTSGSTASVALTNAQQAIDAIGSASIFAKQAAIDDAVDAINEAVEEINAMLTQVEEAIESANDAIEVAHMAAASVSAAHTAAQAALAAAGANETAFNTSVTQFIADQTPAEANALVSLENAVTAAWNAYATAQNQANALANAAAQAIGTGATAAQVEAAIAQAEAAQADADALLQAWLNAETNLQQNIDSTLTTAAENRQQTRYDAATAHRAAVEILVAEAEVFIDAQIAIDNANAVKAQANVQAYITQLNQLIAALDALNLHGYTHTISGGGGAHTFHIANADAEARQQNPNPSLPLHYTYTTTVRRLAFRPDLVASAWPAHIPRNMLQWNNAITFLVDGSSQSSTGAGAGQVSGGAEHVSLAAGQRLMMLDTSGTPIRFNYTNADVTILVEIAFYCAVNGWTFQSFWATGELENTASGTVNIRSLVPAENITITLSVGEIDLLIDIDDELDVLELFEFELGNLFMGITHNLTDQQPPVLTGTVTCDETGHPIPGVTVYLYDDQGNVIDYRVTDEYGFFDFGEVPVGDLVVRINAETIPEGYVVVHGYYRTLTTSPGGKYEAHFYVVPEEAIIIGTPPPTPPVQLPTPGPGTPLPPTSFPYIPWQPHTPGHTPTTPVTLGDDPQPGDILYTIYEPSDILHLPTYVAVAQIDPSAPGILYLAYEDPTDIPTTSGATRRVNPQTYGNSVAPISTPTVTVLALVGTLISLGIIVLIKEKKSEAK